MAGTWAKAAVATSRHQRDYLAEAIKRLIEREALEREYGPYIPHRPKKDPTP